MRVFKKRDKGPKITRLAALNLTPIKNTEIDENRLETGEIQISYQVTVRPRFARLTRRIGGETERVQQKKLQLDELGTAVWDLIDGSRSVRKIIRKFSEIYHLEPKEAEVSVTQFLRDLGKRGLLGMR